MIFILSSAPREAATLANLCDAKGWPSADYQTLRAAMQQLRRVSPRILVVRHKLDDGYSDDAIRALHELRLLASIKVITLMRADTSAAVEARQLKMGADCVLREPIRLDVLFAYLEKYLHAEPANGAPVHPPLRFADSILDPLDRTLRRHKRSVVLTPREARLLEQLIQSGGAVVTYERCYSEIIGCRFRGDTSNMRVLFAKLATSLDRVGLSLRSSVEVIPKTGYRMRSP